MRYRPDIDGLRALAVVPVMVFHTGLGLTGGFVGVDVFFVISGYLITTLLWTDMQARCFSLLGFYERRARRIFPALFTMIALTSLAAVVIMVPIDLEDYGRSVAATTLFLANIWFYTQHGYFTEAAELEPLLHTWSLGVEEQFYVLFPLILWLGLRALRSFGATVLVAVLTLVSLVAAERALAYDPEGAFFLPHLRAWELFLGALLAMATSQGWMAALSHVPRLNQALSVLGLGLIVYAILAFGPETRFPGLSALVPCLGAALLIATGGQGQGPVKALLELPPMVFVGKLSYSLYLWHWPFIAFTYYTTLDLSLVQGLICLLATFGGAYLSWRYIETPTRDRARLSRLGILAGSALVMATLVTAGWTLMTLEGLPGRLPPEMTVLADHRNHLHDRRDCHFVTPARAEAGDLCLRGDSTVAPSFVLVGDSHADSLSPALFGAAQILGLSGYQYTNAGFRPLLGVSKRGDPAWEIEVATFVDFVAARPELRTIYITAYWQHQLTGYTYRHNGTIWVDDGYDGSGTAYNPIATRNGLRRLAAALPDRQIVLLDDVPTGEALHIPTQLRTQRFGLLQTDQIGLPTAERDAQRRQFEPALQAVADEVSTISYQRIFDGLCDASLCPLFDGDTLLYRDGDHLSYQGALRLTPVLQHLLEQQRGS